eukprot:4842842-Prymnesium_polylepis.1
MATWIVLRLSVALSPSSSRRGSFTPLACTRAPPVIGMAAAPLDLSFKRMPEADADAAFAIEEASYPADEAATLEK